MKLAKMAWVVGALSSIALGMAAEACSSSDGGTTTTGGGTNCATLAACCIHEPAADIAACTTLAGQANDSACLMYLSEGASQYCVATPGSGTSGLPGSGTGIIPPPSSGTGSGIVPPGSGTGISPGSGTGINPGSGTGTSPGTDAGTCHVAPGKIYPETPDGGGFYCPFSKPDGGKTAYCTGGSQHCCEPTAVGPLSTCESTACGTGFTDWQCEGTPDCSSMPGTVCCGTGTIAEQAACGAIPAYPYVSGFKGSACMTSCPSGGFQICSQQSECTSGTCTAVEPKGNTIGYCAQ